MKVTLIASVSANGKVLLANNPNHQIAPEVMEFLVQKTMSLDFLEVFLETG